MSNLNPNALIAKMSFFDIPDELQLHIVSYLSLRDLYLLRNVGNRWLLELHHRYNNHHDIEALNILCDSGLNLVDILETPIAVAYDKRSKLVAKIKDEYRLLYQEVLRNDDLETWKIFQNDSIEGLGYKITSDFVEYRCYRIIEASRDSFISNRCRIYPWLLVAYLANDRKLCDILLVGGRADVLFDELARDLSYVISGDMSTFEDISQATRTIELSCCKPLFSKLRRSKHRYRLFELCRDLYRLYPRNVVLSDIVRLLDTMC